MYSYISNSNIICRKNLLYFLRIFFPYIHVDLRCEQFINIKILSLFSDLVESACIAVKHRKGQILQSKDIRFIFLEKKKDIFPKLNFLSRQNNKVKKKLRSKKKNIL